MSRIRSKGAYGKTPQIILSPPEIVPQSIKTKRDKIEEILKKGL